MSSPLPDREIFDVPARLRLPLLSGVALTALCLAIALGWIPIESRRLVVLPFSYFGAVFFAAGSMAIAMRLVQRGPTISLSAAGIRDPRISAESIAWTKVTRIDRWEQMGRKLGALIQVDPEWAKSRRWKFSARLFGARSQGRFWIGSTGTNVEPDELYELCRNYWIHYAKGHA